MDDIWDIRRLITLTTHRDRSHIGRICFEDYAIEGNGSSKSFGQFDYETMWRTKAPDGSVSPTLSQMTEKAISLMDNENGFFLMVEGAHIDKKSHSNIPDEAAEAVEEFDRLGAKESAGVQRSLLGNNAAIVSFIDSMQEEPTSKFDSCIQPGDDIRYNEE